VSLTFVQLTCSKCGGLFEILGTPTPEDLAMPLCLQCGKDGAREDIADARGIDNDETALMRG
jgi:hypothetical protein